MNEPNWTALATDLLAEDGGCPDADALYDLMTDHGYQGRDVAGHLETCLRCQIEFHEMRDFFARPEVQAVPSAFGWRHLMATAAILVAGLGLGVMSWVGNQAPQVPALHALAGALRGGDAPQLLEPQGKIEEQPKTLSWLSETDSPDQWVVELERVDGKLLWSTLTTLQMVDLPPEVTVQLFPGSRYVWRVRAEGENHLAAESSFSIAP